MIEKFSLGVFLKKYSSNQQSLDKIKQLRWPNGITCPDCKKITKFYAVKGRTTYACEFGGYQLSPLTGTIFEKTTTPLQYWFYAIYLMTQTRSGISAKQLQRELGTTYKTAHRMFRLIRTLMASVNTNLLTGVVEVDETFVGGKGKNRAYKWKADEQKEIIMGMVERQGRAYLKHIPNTGKYTLLQQVKENIDPKARVMTDELMSYTNLDKMGYYHQSVKHSKYEYIRGEAHTQNIENVWSHLKRGIYGVYRHVSKKYLQAYADEYAWRYNHRNDINIFENLLKQVAEIKVLRASQLPLAQS